VYTGGQAIPTATVEVEENTEQVEEKGDCTSETTNPAPAVDKPAAPQVF
jgi:hypothetical protein